jgi:hypothetical protein
LSFTSFLRQPRAALASAVAQASAFGGQGFRIYRVKIFHGLEIFIHKLTLLLKMAAYHTYPLRAMLPANKCL